MDARNAAAPAMSSDSPKRPKGTCRTTLSCCFGSFHSASEKCVLTIPGAITLQRTPNCAFSVAMTCAHAEYAVTGRRQKTEPFAQLEQGWCDLAQAEKGSLADTVAPDPRKRGVTADRRHHDDRSALLLQPASPTVSLAGGGKKRGPTGTACACAAWRGKQPGA